MDYVWFTLLLLGMGGLWWLAYRMEPHWSTKDGRRFLCTVQDLTDPERPGRKREARVVVTPDGTLFVTQKQGLRRQQTTWKLIGKSPTPPKRMEIYLAQETSRSLITDMISLRLPTKSRCIPVLDKVLAGTVLD